MRPSARAPERPRLDACGEDVEVCFHRPAAGFKAAQHPPLSHESAVLLLAVALLFLPGMFMDRVMPAMNDAPVENIVQIALK